MPASGAGPSCEVFHLVPAEPLDRSDLVTMLRACGYDMLARPEEEWKQLLQELPPTDFLAVVRDTLLATPTRASAGSGPDVVHTVPALAALGVKRASSISEEGLQRQLGWLADRGFAPPLSRARIRTPAQPTADLMKSTLYRFEEWYPALKAWTFESSWFNLTSAQMHALLSLRRSMDAVAVGSNQVWTRDRSRPQHFTLRAERVGLSASGEVRNAYSIASERGASWAATRRTDFQAVLAEWQSETSSSHNLWKLCDQVRVALDVHLAERNGAFVRLSTRSPKDAFAVLGAQHVPRVTSGEDALLLFASSDRVAQDLRQAEALGLAPPAVVIRSFDLGIAPSREFRLFVHDGSLTACSLYSVEHRSLQIGKHRDELLEKVIRFWTDILQSRVPSHCAVDIAFKSNLAYPPLVIEVNHPPPTASTVLFDWGDAIDRAVLEGSSSFEFRC